VYGSLPLPCSLHWLCDSAHEANTPKFTVAEQNAILQQMQNTFFNATGSIGEHGNGLHRLNVSIKPTKAADHKDKLSKPATLDQHFKLPQF